jgi:CopG family transcriptional regulator, nickel-responsive regulator
VVRSVSGTACSRHRRTIPQIPEEAVDLKDIAAIVGEAKRMVYPWDSANGKSHLHDARVLKKPASRKLAGRSFRLTGITNINNVLPKRIGRTQHLAGITRIGISLDERLLADFDRLIKRKGYANRSEAIRDVIRENLVHDQWETGRNQTIGTITLVYNHETRDLADKLTELQHGHYKTIVSSLHVHLDAHHCLEVLVVRGKAGDLKAMADRLIGTRGVKHGTFSATVEGKVLA